MRRLAAAAFTPRAVARMEDQIREVVTRFAEPLRGRSGIVDLMGEFTDPIPNAVISRITGIPPAGGDERRFCKLAQAVTTSTFPFTPADALNQAEAAMGELASWIREIAEDRRRAPKGDLLSDLVRSADACEATDDEIISLAITLITAGSEGTALEGMVAVMVVLALPDVFEQVRADRSLIDGAVLEIIRHSGGGAGCLLRYAVRDFELHGKQIRRGDMLLLSFGGANRDPRVYPEPDQFEIKRQQARLLSFGTGEHYCLGAYLAKVELRWELNALLDIVPAGATIRYDLMEFTHNMLFPRPTTFPVEF